MPLQVEIKTKALSKIKYVTFCHIVQNDTLTGRKSILEWDILSHSKISE